jgi:hypothetical protein
MEIALAMVGSSSENLKECSTERLSLSIPSPESGIFGLARQDVTRHATM